MTHNFDPTLLARMPAYKEMTWIAPLGESTRILHLRTNAAVGWQPYNQCPEGSNYVVPEDEYSPGFKLSLQLKEQGWKLVSPPRS